MRPMALQTTDYSLHVSLDFDAPCINSARKYLWDNYQAKYSHGPPHITLMFFPIKRSSLTLAQNWLEKFSHQLSSLSLIHEELSLKKSYFLFRVQDDRLFQLHRQVIDLLSAICSGLLRTKDKHRLDQGNYYTHQEIAMLLQYGYPRAGLCYQPHVSIGDLRDHPQANLPVITSHLIKLLSGCPNQLNISALSAALLQENTDPTQPETKLWEAIFGLI